MNYELHSPTTLGKLKCLAATLRRAAGTESASVDTRIINLIPSLFEIGSQSIVSFDIRLSNIGSWDGNNNIFLIYFKLIKFYAPGRLLYEPVYWDTVLLYCFPIKANNVSRLTNRTLTVNKKFVALADEMFST